MDKNNFKIYFSNILSEKYNFTKEQINGYWENKEKENKKVLVDFGKSAAGIVTSAAVLRLGDGLDNVLGSVLVAAGFVGLCASCRFVVSSMGSSHFSLKDNSEIDNEYLIAKSQYIKNRK